MATTPNAPLTLYGLKISGHSHRVELLLSILGLPFEFKPVDLRGGENKTPTYLGLNAFGQVPVLQDGEVVIADSNAILVYLARTYDASDAWLPREPAVEAQVQRWLSAAAGMLAYGPAAARRMSIFRTGQDPKDALALAARLFGVMEGVLAGQAWIAHSAPTIADLALYAYTLRAPEGGVSLEPYPAIRAWLERVEALPGFVPMPLAKDLMGG